MHKPQLQGFTLIELAIVLVIIGLIVGGVLVGKDLIAAAYVRAEVTQLERYNTAVNTFNVKYGGLPGDLLNGKNFFTLVGGGGTGFQNNAVAGKGNGDGLIQSIDGSGNTCNAANGDNYDCINGETQIFWYELSQSGLISESLNGCKRYVGSCFFVDNTMVPSGKIAGSTITVEAGPDGKNYWMLGIEQMSTILGPNGGVPAYNGAALTVSQAYQIDTKIDDGMPGTGSVISISAGEPGVVGDDDGVANFAPTPGPNPGSATLTNNCGNEGNGNQITSTTAYNMALAAQNVNCMLSVRTNF